MKKVYGLILCVLLGFSFLQSAYVGKVYVRASDGQQVKRIVGASQVRDTPRIIIGRSSKVGSYSKEQSFSAKNRSVRTATYFAREISKGNLRLNRVEADRVAWMEHRRYTQYYRGLEVFGGQIIQHFRGGRLLSTTGDYYDGISIDTTPLLDADTASQLYRIHAAKPDLSDDKRGPKLSILPKPDPIDGKEGPKLIIFPITDGDYRLAYRITLANGISYNMTGIIDAKNGEVIKEFSNIFFEDLTIGLGVGVHGGHFKLPTTYLDNSYLLADLVKVRPVNQLTADYRTYDGYDYYIAADADNIWDHDGALVSAHAYLGLAYDYFYSIFGRHGIDDANLPIISTVHDTSDYDNAFWNGINQMFFCDPGPMNWQMAGALDVVSHEYTHGVTQFTSGLLYYCDANAQPGALNESFSDIMGTAIEFYWQDQGQGFDKSDWVLGEDIFSSYSANNYARSLSDPNSKIGWASPVLPYPCHLSQCYLPPNTEDGDWGGVHFNATLYSHAYYLLAAGGTNRISGLGVSGIGIDKATKIFYRAWTYYMTPNASFLNAANWLLQSAYDLYGASSNEYAQTINAMEAIGWIVN